MKMDSRLQDALQQLYCKKGKLAQVLSLHQDQICLIRSLLKISSKVMSHTDIYDDHVSSIMKMEEEWGEFLEVANRTRGDLAFHEACDFLGAFCLTLLQYRNMTSSCFDRKVHYPEFLELAEKVPFVLRHPDVKKYKHVNLIRVYSVRHEIRHAYCSQDACIYETGTDSYRASIKKVIRDFESL